MRNIFSFLFLFLFFYLSFFLSSFLYFFFEVAYAIWKKRTLLTMWHTPLRGTDASRHVKVAYAAPLVAFAASKMRMHFWTVIYAKIVFDSSFSRLFTFLLSLLKKSKTSLPFSSSFGPCPTLHNLRVPYLVLLPPTQLRC